MNLPDFTGMDPEEIKGILKADYPNIEYSFITYFSPKDRRENTNAAVAYRIVRQKVIGDNRLEFTISPFIDYE